MIGLEATAQSLLTLEAEGQALFRATLGQSKGAFTVRLERRLDEREELLGDILAGDAAGPPSREA